MNHLVYIYFLLYLNIAIISFLLDSIIYMHLLSLFPISYYCISITLFLILLLVLYLLFLFNLNRMNLFLSFACLLLNLFYFFLFFLILLLHLLLSLCLLKFPLLVLSFAFLLLLLFTSRLKSVIHRDFPKIMMSEQQWEIAITVAFSAQYNFVLFFRKRRIFRVNIFHDCWYFLWVHDSYVLKPNHFAVYATKITVGSYLWCYFFQNIVSVIFLKYHMMVVVKRISKFHIVIFIIHIDFKKGWRCKFLILIIYFGCIYDAPTCQKHMDLHKPSSIFIYVFSNCWSRHIWFTSGIICIINIYCYVSMFFIFN